MLVQGQLEKAQFEQIASDPALAPTGRVYMNIANPLSAVPYVFNGTEWRPVKLGQSTATIVQSSGIACTVNWANGLTQQVNLTGHASISFSNPQEGEIHTLLVKQVGTGVDAYGYVINMPDQDLSRGNFTSYNNNTWLPVRGTRTYRWFYKSGFKAAYANVPLGIGDATGQLPPSQPSGLNVSPDGKALLVSHATSPFSSIYSIVDKINTVQNPFMGINAIAAPTATVAAALNGKYSPNGDLVAFANGTTPFLQVAMTGGYNRVGAGTGYFSNPGVLPTGAARMCAWHPSNLFVAVAHTTTPFMSIYPISTGYGFGTKLTNPVSLPPGNLTGICFAPTGDYILTLSATTPYVGVWAFNPAAGGSIGAKSADPLVIPSSATSSPVAGSTVCAWSPIGDWVAVLGGSALYMWEFDRATGTFSSVARQVSGAAFNSIAFTPDGKYLIAGQNGDVGMYDVPGFTRATNDGAFAWSGQPQEVTVHPNGETMFFSTSASPFLYQSPLPNVQRNYVRLT